MKKIIYSIRLYFLKRQLRTLSKNLGKLNGAEKEAFENSPESDIMLATLIRLNRMYGPEIDEDWHYV